VSGVELQRLFVTSLGGWCRTLRLMHHTKVVPGARVAGVDTDGLTELLVCTIKLLVIMEPDSKVVADICTALAAKPTLCVRWIHGGKGRGHQLRG
jgi:hypothetical protein